MSKMKELLRKILDNDYIKLFTFVLVSYWLDIIFISFYSSNFLVNREFGQISFFLFNNIPFLLFYLICGLVIGVILKRKILVKSFTAGCVLSLLTIGNYIYLNSVKEIFWYFSNYPHILSPCLLFLLGAFIVKASLREKDRSILRKNLRYAFTIGVIASFIVLACINGVSYFRFFSSPAYKNSLNFEIAIYPNTEEVKQKKKFLNGANSLSFNIQTYDMSLEILKYYDDFFINSGFSQSQAFFNPGWYDYSGITGFYSNHLPDSVLSTVWINKDLEVIAFMVVEQIKEESKKEVIHRTSILVGPYIGQAKELIF